MTVYASKKATYKRKRTLQSIRDNDMIQKRVVSIGNKLQYVTEYIDRYFKTHVTSEILMSLAKIVIEKHNLQIDRLSKRNRTALLCWYSENWDSILQVLNEFNFMEYPRPPKDLSLPEFVESPTPNIPEQSGSGPDPYDLSFLLNVH